MSANLLFVDSPVGVGYSYAKSVDFIPDDMYKICMDLIQMLTTFMNEHPEYQVYLT